MMKKHLGYTLIEVLVVLFIISIVSGTVLMSLGYNNNKKIQRTVNDLAQTITLAQEQAMLQPAVLGLNIQEDRFQLLIYTTHPDKKTSTWETLPENVYQAHEIPNDIQVELKLANQSKEDGEKSEEDQKIIFSTNGDMTPFTINVGKRGADPAYVIKGESDGSLTVQAVSHEQ